MISNVKKLFNEMSAIVEEQRGYTFSVGELQRSEKLVERALNEYKNKGNYTDLNIQSISSQVLQGVMMGWTDKEILHDYGDLKHYDFYDTFLGKSNAIDLFDTLRSYSIPTEILRGVGVGVDKDGDVYMGYRIYTRWDSSGESRVLVEFIIEDAETDDIIYEWDGEVQ